MITELSRLIEISYDKSAAKATLSFSPDTFAVQQLVDAAKEILTNFPYIPGACALMTAIWTAMIRERTKYPIHAVAGSLFIDNHHIFGGNLTEKQTREAFSGINHDWDGHCWVIFGNLIADISLFRTAYSEVSPPILQKKILSKFGKGRGLFVMSIEELCKTGIIYDAKYILTDDQITGLLRGAQTMIENREAL